MEKFGSAPASYNKLRACLKCRLIKNEEQWLKEGCENCPHPENMRDIERMIECTSSRFEGIVSIMNPETSWVARWNKLEGRIPGCYALDVMGTLPEDLNDDEEEHYHEKYYFRGK